MLFEAGNYTVVKRLPDEAAKEEFPDTALPMLKKEILRQADELGGVPGDWSVRFDVDAMIHRQPGDIEEFWATVGVLVFEGPVDPDIS